MRPAGGVFVRDRRVAIVHRSRHDDWSLAKGKLHRSPTGAERGVLERAFGPPSRSHVENA